MIGADVAYENSVVPDLVRATLAHVADDGVALIVGERKRPAMRALLDALPADQVRAGLRHGARRARGAAAAARELRHRRPRVRAVAGGPRRAAWVFGGGRVFLVMFLLFHVALWRDGFLPGHGFFKPSQAAKLWYRRCRHSVDLEVITGNTAAILRRGITTLRALRVLTQQNSPRYARDGPAHATAATMTDEPSRRPAHAPPRPINAYAIFLKTSYACGRGRPRARGARRDRQGVGRARRGGARPLRGARGQGRGRYSRGGGLAAWTVKAAPGEPKARPKKKQKKTPAPPSVPPVHDLFAATHATGAGAFQCPPAPPAPVPAAPAVQSGVVQFAQTPAVPGAGPTAGVHGRQLVLVPPHAIDATYFRSCAMAWRFHAIDATLSVAASAPMGVEAHGNISTQVPAPRPEPAARRTSPGGARRALVPLRPRRERGALARAVEGGRREDGHAQGPRRRPCPARTRATTV